MYMLVCMFRYARSERFRRRRFFVGCWFFFVSVVASSSRRRRFGSNTYPKDFWQEKRHHQEMIQLERAKQDTHATPRWWWSRCCSFCVCRQKRKREGKEKVVVVAPAECSRLNRDMTIIYETSLSNRIFALLINNGLVVNKVVQKWMNEISLSLFSETHTQQSFSFSGFRERRREREREKLFSNNDVFSGRKTTRPSSSSSS